MCCGDVLKLGLGIGAAAVLFPLLVWGGYALLPFDAPPMDSAPLRLVYTLRCSFFAVIPIILGKTGLLGLGCDMTLLPISHLIDS